MSTQEKTTETHEGQEHCTNRPVRTKTMSLKALETAILEKTNTFWKSQRDLEANTNKLLRADPSSTDIPRLREILQSSFRAFEKEVKELKDLYSQDKGDDSDRQTLLATAKKWYDISTSALTSSSLQLLVNDDNRSQASPPSTASSAARRLEARAKLAEQQARFEYEEHIRRKNAELEQKKLEMEVELQKLKSQRDLRMAEACAKVYDTEEYQLPNLPLPNETDKTTRTQEWLNNDVRPKFSTQMDTSYSERKPKVEYPSSGPPWTQQSEKFAGNYPLFNPSMQYPYEHQDNTFLQSCMDMQHRNNKQLISSLAKQSLPKCEPDVFSGDAPLFLPWKMSFRAMINDVDATPEQELTYLVRYTTGKPQQLVNTYRRRIHPDVRTKVDSLWKCLEERFGHSAEITNSLLENLQKAALFKPDDREGFQRFYDVCEDVNSQIPYLQGLSILNSSYYMKNLVDKVPKVIRDKWESRITRHMVGNKIDDYPPFHMFVEVVHNVAIKRNHPAIIKVAGADYESSSKTQRYKPSNGSPRRENTRTLKTEVKLNSTTDKGQSEEEVKCPLHPEARRTHTLDKCHSFAERSIHEREKIVSDAKICFRCLKKKHFSKFCKTEIICTTCGRRHNTLLHRDQDQESSMLDTSTSSQSGEKVETSCMLICGSQSVTGKSCGKIVLAEVFDRDNPNLKFRSYINLDDQSNHTLGTRLLMDSLQVAGENQPYTLETCNGKKVCSGRRGSNLSVRSFDGRVFNLPTVIESENIPEDKNEIPTPDVIAKIPHLAAIAKYIPPLDKSTGIHLLIGRDAPELLKVREFINGSIGVPWAQRMDLGWTVSGELCLDRQGGRVHVKSRRTHVGEDKIFEQCQNEIKCREIFKFEHTTDQHCTSLRSNTTEQSTLNEIVNNVFLTTDKDSELGSSPEDRTFLQCMENNFHVNDNGNWEAPLPFRNPNITMPDNYVQAEKRFEILKRNFKRNSQLQQDYFDFMEKIIQRGHASLVPESELSTKPGKKWYLPHFAVYHPQKNQIRVVFDSSAEYRGTSLNQELLQGPDLMNKLFGRLLRFRQHNVGIMCDVEQMFHSFHVNPEHRDFLRFLWFAEDKSQSLTAEYRMNVHLFGNGPSPAIATFGLRKAADYQPKKYDESVRKFIKEDFYVDDGVYSCKSSDEAVNLLKLAQEMLMESKLRLHKIVSNNSDVMEAFPQEDLAKSLTDLDLTKDELPNQRTLVVQWDLAKDVFTFKVINKEKPYTRRGVLSVINSIYDPFGFLAPFTIIGKTILQKLIQLGNSKGNPLSWDDPLPPDLEAEWYNWHNGLRSLHEVQVDRCLHPIDFGCIARTEVHAFSDASKDSLGIAIYLRLFDTNGRIHVSFISQASQTPIYSKNGTLRCSFTRNNG